MRITHANDSVNFGFKSFMIQNLLNHLGTVKYQFADFNPPKDGPSDEPVLLHVAP